MKLVLVIAALGFAAFAPPSVADSLPRRGETDSRIRTAMFDPNEVYRLSGFVGYHVDLEFEADESFVGISAGDPEAITYSAHDNVLTLRPKAPAAQMNLTVTTTKRRYYFDYAINSRTPSRFGDEVMYAVRFVYPPAPENMLTPAEQVERDLEAARSTHGRNVDYWFCGSRSIKPVAASDDGVHTRIRFGARGELPAIFVRNDDGSESLLNFSIDDGDVVIHRVAARFILRRGKLTGCVVNKGFGGGGDRLESGTITPAVTRERKGVRHE
jgi:type IV secretion system protein VirB9